MFNMVTHVIVYVTYVLQDYHLSGTPGNVWEFVRCHENVREFTRIKDMSGKNLVRENCLFLTSSYGYTVFSRQL